ncbi:ribonuclease P protein component [Rhodoblastus sp. 17X3]|uniref:ribonuclease P protein component n=1 Tax=Rhodoblastus sp. 17X3 TaxID=3047026 RepID=UPI0024B7D94B|nr:ribonuclease P protein component [Rhodoblastus sp. 17X3]MDI9846541.1 ribonuclease P protein component [Rhodoblastus sp. 17X3]
MTRPEDGDTLSTHAVSGVRLGVLRLKKRADFVSAAKGRRQHQHSFVLQARERDPAPDCVESARVGFTVTKKVGNSVVRNRIRRRLREAVRLADESLFQLRCDYVLAARREALAAPFDELRGELARALKKIHRAGSGRSPAAQAADRKQDL